MMNSIVLKGVRILKEPKVVLELEVDRTEQVVEIRGRP